jgi:hypothetical protein
MPHFGTLSPSARRLLRDVEPFARTAGRVLRAYQAECARAVVRSVTSGDGKIITVMFPKHPVWLRPRHLYRRSLPIQPTVEEQ